MAASTLLSRAKNGDAAAIAQLINQQLQPRGVTVFTARLGTCLRLGLEAEELPRRDSFVAYLKQALVRLDCAEIERVEIVARCSGQQRPSWQAALALGPLPHAAVKQALEQQPLEQPIAQPPVKQSLEQLPAHPSETTFQTPRRRPLPPRWVIALQWFLASLTGLIFALAVLSLIAMGVLPIISSLTGLTQLNGFGMVMLFGVQLILGMPIAGLIIGHTQTRMLRRYLRGISGWQLITPLGLSMGFLLAVITHFVGHTVFDIAGLADSLGQATGTTGYWLSQTCTTLAIGLGCGFLGLSQYALLSGRLRHARRWILLTGVSGMGAWLVGRLLFGLASPLWEAWASHFNLSPTVFGILISSLVGWLCFQGSLAISLAKLIRPQSESKSALSEPTAAQSMIQPASKPLVHAQL